MLVGRERWKEGGREEKDREERMENSRKGRGIKKGGVG